MCSLGTVLFALFRILFPSYFLSIEFEIRFHIDQIKNFSCYASAKLNYPPQREETLSNFMPNLANKLKGSLIRVQ